MPETAASDLAHMRAALGLARRGLGNVWPNPAVGCVIVKEGRVVGRGWTQPGGRPHAETEALARAGSATHGATAYVTLEPCSHWGKTPPCADALIAAGLARVVAAMEDPDRRVSGNGHRRLGDAGIAVESGLCAAEAAEINAGFFQRVRTGLPLVTLKLATSLDGRIATASGESRWITGPAARERGHLLRATHDAILAGTGTVLADDPQLTCRLPGLAGQSPVRVALDARSLVPLNAKLMAEPREVPTWFITGPDLDPVRRETLDNAGVIIIPALLDAAGQIDLGTALTALGAQGLTRVLVEGGGVVAASLLRAGLVDRLVWFHAPLALGGGGIPAVAALGSDKLSDAPRFVRLSSDPIGADTVSVFRVERD